MSKSQVFGITPPPTKTQVFGVKPPEPYSPPVAESPHKEYIDNIKGDTGDSAYESAVKLGFNGTEAEWLLSLASGGLIDPTTNLPPAAVVEALSDAIVAPYEISQAMAYQLGKI